jgi:GTP-binding protein EngB required for normal cell division
MSKYGHTITPICFDPQHSPEEYRKPVFYSYLDKPQVDSPPYSLPSANKELDSQVVNLEPKMSSVEIHCYDEEICIIVSGDNLWFSRDAQVLKWSVCTTLSKNTNLQFQALVTGQQIQPTELPQVVTIRLGTCFSQYVMEKSVAVTVKNYAVSIRQAQIARLVPAELIEVAMLSAALERRGDMGDGPLLYSERYHAVMNFFLTALEVVPIESVAKALRIAHVLLPHWEQYGLELLLSFEGKLPPSTFFKTDLLIYLSSLGSFRNLTKDGRKQLDKIVGYMAKSPASARVISEKSIKMLFNRAPPTLNPLVMLENTSEKIDHLLWDQEILTASPQHIKKDSTNVDVLSLIKELRLSAVNFGFLTDSFMSSQVQIPLVKSPENTARAIDSSDDSVGVWYLVGLNFVKMSKVLKKNKKLVIDVIDYLGKILPEKQKRAASYSAKLQFIDQAMSDTVSCSSQFVGYSLERQLKEMCEGCGITAETTIGQICHDWDNFFAKKILSYVASTFRPLIARWIKWMLAVHELREALASQTIIGVVGLMNSGKSTLLNRIFCQKVPSGTSEAKRTTVPFLYSLGPDVEGVDVIDFPGVDDNDDLIRVLCKILFDLAQVAVFVVEYKNGHSLASMMWLKNIIQSQRIPILICLTHADKLYAEHITGGKYPTLEIALGVVEDYRKEFLLKVEKECGGTPPDCKMCTLALDKDSMLANKEGRRRLKDAGIQGPEDIARWIIDVLNRRGQCEIAENLKKFFKLPH